MLLFFFFTHHAYSWRWEWSCFKHIAVQLDTKNPKFYDLLTLYITKFIECKNKGKHLQMGKRGKQPKIYQKAGINFLLFKKLMNLFHMSPCLLYIFLINEHHVYLQAVITEQVQTKKFTEHRDYSLCKYCIRDCQKPIEDESAC